MPDVRRLPVAEGVAVIKNLAIPMRDGVRLAADLYLPAAADLAGGTRLPVVMEYLPYRKDEVSPLRTAHYLLLPRHGYAVARVDIRGTGGSEGASLDEYSLEEQLDGYDAVEWLAAQPWCDGHVNLLGISYGGFTALQVAAHRPPHLTSIIPVDFTDDRYTDDCHYRGGLLRMYYDLGWYGTRMAAWNAMPPDPDWSGAEWAAVWERHLAENEPYLLRWLRHQVNDAYWRPGSVRDFPDRIVCPAFLVGGWRDGYPNPPLRLFQALAGPKKVLIGPWNHAWPDAGVPGPRIDFWAEVVRWLDHWCRGLDTGLLSEPPITVFMQRSEPPVVDRLESAGAWRSETAWPPPGAHELRLYLQPGQRLGAAPGPAGLDTYAYHPAVGVAGGLWSGGVPFGLPGDQRPDEALSLVYTSEPLQAEVSLLGWPRVHLHVSSSAAVMGFAVSLSDVAPDGASHLIAKGMLNGTRRRSLAAAEPLPTADPPEAAGPDAIVPLDIEIDCTGWVFAAGHRIRLSVASADFPNVWPTPEPGVIAVHHGAGRPSCLVLPGVPAAGSAAPPALRPSPMTVIRQAEAVDPPVWQVAQDVLTGRVTSTIRLGQSFRAGPAAVVEREFGVVCSVTPSDPAHASARGWHVNRVTRPNAVITGRGDTLVHATAEHFHVTIDLEVRVNDAVHFQRRWTETVPRWLL